jgi:hypothetical protein
VTLSDLDLENRLRDQRVRAAEIPPAPFDLAQQVRERAHAERRRQVRLAAAAIAAALVFVGLPALASSLTAGGSRSESAAPATSRAPAPSHLDLPTRGSLAGNDDWLAGVRGLSWLPADAVARPPDVELPDPAVEERKVVFAGDVPGGRVALVMAQTRIGQPVQAWFAGPERARPADMRLISSPGGASRREPMALLVEPDPESGELVLVLVAHPGDEAEVMTGREVAASGETRELWRHMRLEGGAGALTVGRGLTMPPALQVRITRPGQQSPVSPLLSFADDAFDAARGPVPVEDPRGLLGVADAEELQWAVENLMSQFGPPAEQLRPTLLFAGPVGAGSTTSVVLVGVTFPSGATTTSLAVYWGPDDGGMSMTTVSTDPTPAGIALVDQLIAVATSNAVVVSGPSAAVTAEVLRDDGTLLTTVPLVDGAGSGPLAPPSRPYERILLTVRVLDDGGNVLAESTVQRQG